MIVMSGKEKIYTGVFTIERALNSVSIGQSDGRPVKYPRPATIKEQEYNRVFKWMSKYSNRFTIDGSGKMKVKEKPILATEEEMKRDLGITWGQLRSIAKGNDDVGASFHYNADISEEHKKGLESVGLKTGVFYVALESQYPFLSKIFEKQK